MSKTLTLSTGTVLTIQKNPRNWSPGKKLVHVLLISGFTLYSNLAAVMFAPAAQDVAKEFGITNSIVESLTATIYLL
ncbi:MFS transporter [Penicillium malachiteum]|uniref:MFS transporter n=1 Tax=Penicillium malachiteum TaxID=1324776 RepID=A0AAD6HMH9_9EURO|nr:MFS transporter [Penicillium malachiteum]